MLKYILAVIMLYSCTAWANSDFVFPNYLDDDAYEYCMNVTHESNNCIKEESQRVLKDVKILYKNILADPQMTSWNGSLEANRDVLRDMYESWSAYRNRLCSLNKVVSVYIAPLFDPELSCTLYQNYNHKDYLNQILHTLNSSKAKNPYPARLANVDGGNHYLEIDHDEKYIECKNNKELASLCLKEESQRSIENIKAILAQLLDSSVSGKWNNGPDLKNGNYRDMFDSWVAFRNRMCSLTTYVQKQIHGIKGASLEKCIQFYNLSFQETLATYLLNSNSYLDEEMLPASDAEEEGGEAEGKKIKPLERKFSPNINDSLSTDSLVDEGTTENPVEETAEEPKNTDDRDRKIPSWAKQK